MQVGFEDQVMVKDSNGNLFHLRGLSSCQTYEEFEHVLNRQIDRSRSSKWYWMYNDNSPRIKIDMNNYAQGLKDEKLNLCFILISYGIDSPPSTLTKENLSKYTADLSSRKLEFGQSPESSEKSAKSSISGDSRAS